MYNENLLLSKFSSNHLTVGLETGVIRLEGGETAGRAAGSAAQK